MNEFLKNLRSSGSGKLHQGKGQQGTRTGHYNPLQGERRSGNDRRSTPSRSNRSGYGTSQGSESATSAVMERISAQLERLAMHQERIANAKERLADAEERKTLIIESFAEPLRMFFNSGQAFAQPSPVPMMEAPPVDERVQRLDEKMEAKLNARRSDLQDREMIVQMIRKMRKNGSTYEQIAKFLDEENIQTFSKKGKWHAQTIHRLCKS